LFYTQKLLLELNNIKKKDARNFTYAVRGAHWVELGYI